MKNKILSKLASRFTLAAAMLVASGASAQENKKSQDEWTVGGNVTTRLGTQAAPLTTDWDYLPVYPQKPGAMTGGGVTFAKSSGDKNFMGGTYLYSVNRTIIKGIGGDTGNYLLPGGFLRLDGMPGLSSADVYGYTLQQVDAKGGNRLSLRNYGFNLATQALHLAGTWALKAKGGVRLGGADTSVDPPMSYALLGLDSEKARLYAGAFMPLQGSPEALTEVEVSPTKTTRLSLQTFINIDSGADGGPYHSRLRLLLAHDFSAVMNARLSATASRNGFEEVVLKAGYAAAGGKGFFVNGEGGVVKNPASQETQALARISTGFNL